MILGTAGHVDHGKTALVQALTGVDTDRLAEEKRRGITIDLGFAPLSLGNGTTLGVVDVPGHEAFVRNMLAGATGVDLALLVVAADEGVMPQTLEHLAILSLLGVRGGVIALSKTDLVDAEWLALVMDDVSRTLAGTPLERAPVIGTSVRTGTGIAELRDALASAASSLPVRDADDLFRMPVDRAFTVRGTGTVVTGTVWSGKLDSEATVRILPRGRTARVRGMESHGIARMAVHAGNRVAIALAGMAPHEVARGATLVTDDAWAPSSRLLAEVRLLDSAAHALGPRSTVRFHLGTSDVGARVVAEGGRATPGASVPARLVLDAPVVARAGDRFVLRGASPLVTLGGGIVVDPLPDHRRARPRRVPDDSGAALRELLRAAGPQGVPRGALPVRAGVRPGEVAALAESDAVVAAGDDLFAPSLVATLAERVLSLVDAHHSASPLEPGVPLQRVRAVLAAPPQLSELVLARLVAEGRLSVRGALVARDGWVATPEPAQALAAAEIARVLGEAGREPPGAPELAERFGGETMALLRYLERSGAVIAVEAERFFARGALEGVIGTLRERMIPGVEHTPHELREFLGVSRKFLIPLLEYCDREGITVRRPAGRVLGRR